MKRRHTRQHIGRLPLRQIFEKSPPVNYRGPAAGESGWLYVIQSGGACKVGVTNSVKKRMAILAIGNPLVLRLVSARRLQSMSYALIAETIAHRMLSTRHERGEWFNGDPASIAATASIAAAAVRALHYRHWGMKRRRSFVEMAGEPSQRPHPPYQND